MVKVVSDFTTKEKFPRLSEEVPTVGNSLQVIITPGTDSPELFLIVPRMVADCEKANDETKISNKNKIPFRIFLTVENLDHHSSMNA